MSAKAYQYNSPVPQFDEDKEDSYIDIKTFPEADKIFSNPSTDSDGL